jgi:hypothetical protein
MAEARPGVISFGAYAVDGREPTPVEIAEMNERAERRRQEIRTSSLAMIGLDASGHRIPAPDSGEERRLETSDMRGALHQAQLERRQISLRGVDQKAALARGQQHLEETRAALHQLEERVAAGERAAADQLADSFRGSETATDERLDVGTFPATSEIEAARLAVRRAQNAVATLTGEVEATQRELGRAQYVVDRAVADVVRQKLLAIAQQIDEHDRAAAELRASMRAAGFATANVARRAGWPRRVFTSTMLSVLDRGALDGTSRADWRDFISRLDQDAEAQLE